jgi:hypothetical protein
MTGEMLLNGASQAGCYEKLLPVKPMVQTL